VSDAVHPLLPSATPLLHDDGDLQVGGVDTGPGVLVPSGGWLEPVLRGLDGRRAQRAILRDAQRDGLDPAAVATVLDGLRATGLLVDLDPADLLAAGAGPASAARTAAELPPGPDGGAAARRARRTATVVVEGATRVGVPLAAVLAASGVGRIAVRDAGLTRAGEAVVGGLTAADEGRPRSMAAADAVRRADPLADLRPVAAGEPVDLVVLARPWAASDPLVEALRRDGVPHLVATVRGSTGVVGPLVVPGVTGCLRCGDLHRRDADPRWPRLAAQLTSGEPPASGATVTCLLTAVVGAVQALAFLGGTAAPAALDATLEMRPPALLPTRREWPPHPSCACAPERAAGPARAG
jgi:ThiF family